MVRDSLSDKDRLAQSADAIAQQVAGRNKDGTLTVKTAGGTMHVTTAVPAALNIDSSMKIAEIKARVDSVRVQTKLSQGVTLYIKDTSHE